MSDSFFGFDTHLESDTLEEGLVSDEEDEDYDALNDETFGEDVFTGDWEEDHEKLAELTELSRHGGRQENGDLSSQIAAFVFDDEPLRNTGESLESLKPKPRPPPGFRIVNNGHLDIKPPLPPLTNLCTVEEIERNLIKAAPTSFRLEDLERKLIHKPPGSFVRSPPPYNSLAIQPPRQSAFGGPLQKVHLFPQFQMHPQPHLIIPPGLMGMRGVQQQHMFVRVGQNIGARGPLFPVHRPPEDEYAGLMTSKDKHWLASIQLLQLSTNTPYQDDYYYIMYQHRQSGHHGRKIGCALKTLREQHPLTKSTYTPLQFENSLGKLQAGSVMAPRKIIDTDIVESIECAASTSSSKKVKQTLLEIEHMFSDVLLAEEALSPLATHSTEQIDPTQLFGKTVNILLKNDKLKTILNIRKGKTLVLRILSHPQISRQLAHKLVTILPSVAKKDSEQAMLRALPAIRHYLANSTVEELVELSESLQSDLPFLLSNKFGISVMANMMERAEMQMTQLNSESSSWIKFVTEILSVCSAVELERPVVGINGPTLSRHLSRCVSANNQHIAILQKALSTFHSIDKL